MIPELRISRVMKQTFARKDENGHGRLTRASEVGQAPRFSGPKRISPATDCFAPSKRNQRPARPFSREGTASAGFSGAGVGSTKHGLQALQQDSGVFVNELQRRDSSVLFHKLATPAMEGLAILAPHIRSSRSFDKPCVRFLS